LWAAWTFVRRQDTRTLSLPGAPERVCDTVAEFDHALAPGRRCSIDVKLQAQPDAAMLERVGEYAVILRRERRHGPGQAGNYEILGLVVNLTGAEQANRLDVSVPEWSEAAHRLQTAQATLSRERAEPRLARIAARKLERWVLVRPPLLRGAAEPATIAEWLRLAAQEPDSQSRFGLGPRRSCSPNWLARQQSGNSL